MEGGQLWPLAVPRGHAQPARPGARDLSMRRSPSGGASGAQRRAVRPTRVPVTWLIQIKRRPPQPSTSRHHRYQWQEGEWQPRGTGTEALWPRSHLLAYPASLTKCRHASQMGAAAVVGVSSHPVVSPHAGAEAVVVGGPLLVEPGALQEPRSSLVKIHHHLTRTKLLKTLQRWWGHPQALALSARLGEDVMGDPSSRTSPPGSGD